MRRVSSRRQRKQLGGRRACGGSSRRGGWRPSATLKVYREGGARARAVRVLVRAGGWSRKLTAQIKATFVRRTPYLYSVGGWLVSTWGGGEGSGSRQGKGSDSDMQAMAGRSCNTAAQCHGGRLRCVLRVPDRDTALRPAHGPCPPIRLACPHCYAKRPRLYLQPDQSSPAPQPSFSVVAIVPGCTCSPTNQAPPRNHHFSFFADPQPAPAAP